MADAFSPKFKDLVRCYTTTVGTGDFALGPAFNGYSTFGDNLQPGDAFYYSCIGIDKPAEREIGRGTLINATTIARSPVNGVKTNFTKGNKAIALVAASEWFSGVDQSIASIEAEVGALAAGGGTQTQAVQIAEDTVRLSQLSSSDPAATLTEIGREGAFTWDGSDHSPLVAADPRRGIVVAPAVDPSGASGAWVRQFEGGIRPEWFGAKGDDANLSGTDDSAAFLAAIKMAVAFSNTSTLNPLYKGAARIELGAKTYFLGSTTLELTNNIIVEGVGNGISLSNATVLRWAADTTGIRVLDYNSAGAVGEASLTHTTASGTTIRGLMLYGGFSGAEGEFHGIHGRTRLLIEDVRIYNYAGDGIHIVADTQTPAVIGNANNWRINRVSIENCRDGVHVAGGDTNGGLGSGVVAANNRRWGIFDDSFLGCTWLQPLGEANGTVVGSTPTMVSDGTRRFVCRYGQEAGAAVNAPPASATNSTYWAYVEEGGAAPGANIPAWTSGIVVRAGGAGCIPNPNSRSLVLGAYQEGGQGLWQTWSNVLAVGGPSGSIGPNITAAGDRVVVGAYQGLKTGKLLATDLSTLHGATSDESIDVTGGKRFSVWNGQYVGSYRMDATGIAILDGWNYAGGSYLATRIDGPRFSHYDPSLGGEIFKSDPAGVQVLTGTLGYGSGAGGTVAQATSKSTGVTLNRASGQIIMNGSALVAGEAVSFTLNNDKIAATDTIILNVASGSAAGAYGAAVDGVSAGACVITVRNHSGTSLSDSLILNFAVLKGSAN